MGIVATAFPRWKCTIVAPKFCSKGFSSLSRESKMPSDGLASGCNTLFAPFMVAKGTFYLQGTPFKRMAPRPEGAIAVHSAGHASSASRKMSRKVCKRWTPCGTLRHYVLIQGPFGVCTLYFHRGICFLGLIRPPREHVA